MYSESVFPMPPRSFHHADVIQTIAQSDSPLSLAGHAAALQGNSPAHIPYGNQVLAAIVEQVRQQIAGAAASVAARSTVVMTAAVLKAAAALERVDTAEVEAAADIVAAAVEEEEADGTSPD